MDIPPARQNDPGLIHTYIDSELKKAGIELQKIGRVGHTFTVTTDREVPEAIRSAILDYARYKSYDVTWLTLGQER